MSKGIAKIDFSGLSAASSVIDDRWKSARSEVMDALSTVGCFEATYSGLDTGSQQELGELAMDLFQLPLQMKLLNSYGPDKPFHGYLGGLTGLDGYESLAIRDAHLPQSVRDFSHLMWPHGNPRFCETVHNVAKHLAELEKMVRRMVLETLGVQKYYENQNESMWYLFRIAEYRAPGEEEKDTKKLGYYSHQDINTLSIVKQIQADGLEIQTGEGDWITLTPSKGSFIVLAGNAFRAWTNGRVHAPFHRVLLGGDMTRYSSIMFSDPGENELVEAPRELVDEHHPLLFKPYDSNEFARFYVSKEGSKVEDKLQAFCGLSATSPANA